MKNKPNEKNFKIIESLIQQEEEEAVRIFRQFNFKSRVTQRIQAETQKSFLSVFWAKKSVLAACAVLILIALGWVVIHILNPLPYKRKATAIEKVLSQTPFFQRVVDKPKARDTGFQTRELVQEIERLKKENKLNQLFSQILQKLEEV